MAYHHRDARAALTRAASELLESEGAASLSLRAIADRAGLSHQAPYNHFRDKQAMLAALAEIGFKRLSATLTTAAADKPGRLALAAAGEAYIDFAQDHPAMFRLMFSRELIDVSRHPDAAAASDEAYAILTRIVQQLCAPAQTETVSLAAWSIVHGYATLCNETGLEPPGRAELRAWQFARLISETAAADHSTFADESRRVSHQRDSTR